MKTITTYIVDSFTDEPFKGNPAAVCILKQELSDKKMLLIAKELGLSETAFIFKQKKDNKYAIRFFSPRMEIPLCGHATLAASEVVFERNIDLNDLHFVNIHGLDLMIKREGDYIKMEFPVYDTRPADAPVELLNALGLKTIVNSVYNVETEILLLELEDSQIIKDLKPDFTALVHSHDSINGVLITAPSNKDDFDFESRYFWPWSGTNEDPVTGATHTFLAKYWSKRLSKIKMNSFQCSERTGFMQVELIGNNKFTIKSKAQIVLEGQMRI